MIRYNPSKILYSLHIHKCGGTSFREILKSWFKYSYFPYYVSVLKNPFYRNILPVMKTISRFKPVVIHGHFISPTFAPFFERFSKAEQFITFLRNPLDLYVSSYYYIKQSIESNSLFDDYGNQITHHPAEDLEDYLLNHDARIMNDFPWDLTINNFEKIFEKKFIHIGIMEQYQKSVDILAEKLGRKQISLIPHTNKSKKDDYLVSSNVKNKFCEKHELEMRIYEFASNLNKD